MNDPDIRDLIPLLRQFGVSPDQLGPEKVQKLIELAGHIRDPSAVTPEVASQLMDTLGIQLRGRTGPVKKKGTKVRRNAKCPCGSGVKWKKCCGTLGSSKISERPK